MATHFLRIIAALATASCLLTATAQEHTAVKHKFDLPPSADLSYTVKAKQSGLSLSGEAHINWNTDGDHFSLSTEMRAMLFGKIMETKSEGTINAYGIAPTTFTDKRFRKDVTTTSFNRDSKIISFSASDQTYPIKGDEQDRNSAIWQLIAIARATPAKFKPGSEWPFFVAGQRDADPWSFKVLNLEKIKTPMGDISTVHLLKSTLPDQNGQQVEIWLAPSLDWYPVRLRYTETDGDLIEQTLTGIEKKPS